MTSKVAKLKDALLDELIDQVQNGTKIEDKESGELVKLSTPAAILSVAAKVVKDFADEGKVATLAKSEHMSSALARYKERGGIPAH